VKPGWLEKVNCVKEAQATSFFGVIEEPRRGGETIEKLA
jgi:hypothetical protein